ncbi:MAG TPA: MFS transporter [Desulfobulbus sp.]|nr:MFS transporter [Desulfobulbus sp.]
MSLLLLAAIFYLNFFSRIIFAPLLPAMEEDLGLSHGQAGSFFLILSCGYFAAQAGSGFISSTLGHKRTILLSMLAISACLLLMSLAPSLAVLRAGFALLGMAAGIYLPSGIATISELFTPARWGRAYGVHELAPNLAFLTAPLLAALLLPRLPWQYALLYPGAATLAAALFYALFGQGARMRGVPPNPAHCRLLLRLSSFWLMVLLFAMGISGTLGVYSVLPTFLVSVHHLSEQDAGVLVGLSRTSTLLSALLGGWLADRFGSRRTMAMVLLLTGIATLLLGLAPTSSVRIWVWLQPLLAVCFFPAAFSLLAGIGPPMIRNVVVSLTVPLAFVIGGGMVPALVTRMADRGAFGQGLVLTGLFISSGALLVHMVREYPPARQA